MNETLTTGLLIGACILMIMMFCLLIRAFRTIHGLSKDIREHRHLIDTLFSNNVACGKRCDSLESSVEKLKGSVEVLTTSQGNWTKLTDARLGKLEKYENDTLIKAVNRLIEVVDNLCDKESEDWVGGENKGLSEPSEGIQKRDIYSEGICGNDYDGDSVTIATEHGDTGSNNVSEIKTDTVSYRWIFPDRDRDAVPVFGQWCLVVGESSARLKEDGSPMIWTDEGFWNGHAFVSSGDVRFDKVYAYIELPASADIMEQVVSMALEKVG